MHIEALGPGDDQRVLGASHLFDGPARTDATARFLTDDRHHILVAYDVDRPVGFVTGVETTHPDKGTEMFLYELAVEESHRRRGVGGALVDALAEIARRRGCFGMWVATDDDNDAARATYRRTASEEQLAQVVYVWTF